MKAAIDAAGRVVVPGEDALEIQAAPTEMRLQKRGKGVVAIPAAKLPTLTAEAVRDTLEQVRR